MLVAAVSLLAWCNVSDKLYAPLGLVTSPNVYGVMPIGGMTVARNLVMRNKGELLVLPDTRSYRDDVMSAGYTVRRLATGVSSVLAIGDNAGAWQARWVTSGASTAITTTPAGMSAATFDTAKAYVAKLRDRFFVTSLNDGVLALDSEGDTTVRAAGLRGLNIAPVLSTATNAVSLANGMSASWVATWKRVQSDGYELINEPSLAHTATNDTGATIDCTWVVMFATSAGVQAGDYIILNRTKQVASGNDPGGTFYESITTLVTAGHVAAGYVFIKDTTTDAMLGEELYSNPGQRRPAVVGVGGSYVNSPPGLATDAWVFDGRAFYLTQRLASFIKLRIAGTWGTLTSEADRASGVGRRAITGDTTNGSPTMINVVTTTGVVAGQRLPLGGTGTSGFAVGDTVLSKTATTITMSANSGSTQVGATMTLTDLIEINGIVGESTSLGKIFADGPILYTGPSQDAFVVADRPAGWSFTGISPSFVSTVGTTVVFRQGRYGDGVLTIRATNEQNYSPPIANISATATNGSYDERANRIQWSKDQQPEAVPPQQEEFYGHGAHYRAIATKEAVWLFASDGLWRSSGSDDLYSTDRVDPNLIIASRNAACELNGSVYAYTNRGLVKISDGGGVEYIARDVINDLLPGAAFSESWTPFMVADQLHREIWLTFSTPSQLTFVYSEVSGAFTDALKDTWTAGAYSESLRSLVWGVFETAPDLDYFEDDTTATRMDNAEARFQPFTRGDPFALKEFLDVNFVFVGFTSAGELTPTFGGVAYNPRVIPAQTAKMPESRVRVAVPVNAPALAARLTPGFTVTSGGKTNVWSLRGLSVSAVGAGDSVKL